MFERISPAPADPILGLTEEFNADPRPYKVNLGVGVYQDDEGKTPVLEAVKAAEAALLATETTKTYLPIAGPVEFGRQVEALLFPKPAPIVVRTAQTPGGTGALRVAAEFLRQVTGLTTVWVTDPTWPNHQGIFTSAGFMVKSLPYYDAGRRALASAPFIESLERVEAGNIVCLHLCCHNPSGADPDERQWAHIASLARERGWFPLLDAAYIGFGDGLEPDCIPLRYFVAEGVEFAVAVSFSKNFGLYAERAGALLLVAHQAAAADAAFSRLKQIVRTLYSNPPAHGGAIVRTILCDALLRDVWRRELDAMRGRIHAMREALAEGLQQRVPDCDFSFITRQRGMFSFSGLSPAQVQWLRAERAIYMTTNGRINVAGLTSANVDCVCEAVAAAMRAVS